jgi:lactoylglutathione lyase
MIKRVEHTAIIVKDLDKSIEYYSTIFGFKLRIRGRNERREMAFIYLENEANFEIELIRDLVPSISYSPNGIVNHLAFTVESIDESIHNLSSKGIVFKSEIPNIAIDGAKTIFFDGPNGEILQLVERKDI